jgi:hypothetical protein
MPLTIARKLWIPLAVGIVVVSLVQGWTMNQPSANQGDYRRSLKLLLDATDSTLRSVEYKHRKPAL